MFTGLVQATGSVIEARPHAAGVLLEIQPAHWEWPAALGDSISVSGCCLTLARAGAPFRFDVVPETLSKTSLGGWKAGRRVNLESSVTPATLLGGHLVQGHVDGVGEVLAVQREGDWRVRVRQAIGLMEYVVPKGSIAMDGVSLTIAAVEPCAPGVRPSWFEVALIPTTLSKTTLGDLRPGDSVNLEADSIAKTIVHWLRHYR